ncbi:MAG TPA: trypsin-like serine protease, partial [Candidatus Hydrogenedentes bacterium]|nr:trypsin-like serine protease [Candidatus Hydrogenedentota bacterium]
MRKALPLRTVFALAALAILVSAIALVATPRSATAAPGKTAVLEELSDAFSQLAESASEAVVFINVSKEMKRNTAPFSGPFGAFPDDFFERFFGPGNPWQRPPQRKDPGGRQVPYGQGSGFIISSDGHIVTNHHVVGDADTITVHLADNRKMEAELVGSDPNTEIAIIKIDAKDLPTLPLADSDQLRVGEWVVAIGSPFGLSHSVTAGIVSARGRGNVGIADYADFIQTDAAINPGNSGGPLLNLQGSVVGVNTAIFSRSGGYMGIGFAIPINMVKYIYDQLRENGEISRGYLGVL